MNEGIPFAGSPLDRVSVERRDRNWLDKLRGDPTTRYLPLWKLEPLVKAATGEDPRRLAWATDALLEDIDPEPQVVLLGMAEGAAHFAVDVSSVADPLETFGLTGSATFEDLRAAAGQLDLGDTAIAAQARSLIDWHARHRYCAVCGSKTVSEQAGAHRRCISCGAEHFARTDPVGIAVVVRGDRCLLGRNKGWPPSMFSALAGFIEPGETLEEAVRREIAEESGVRVGAVRYVRSQPWPFPSSLMIGCIAEAESEEIQIDPAEIEEARWFTLEEVRAALAGSTEPLAVPPPFAIAHHLIRAWAETFES